MEVMHDGPHNAYCLPNVVLVIMSRRMKHRMFGEKEIVCRALLGKLERKRKLG
jgi:hypothetical protein